MPGGFAASPTSMSRSSLFLLSDSQTEDADKLVRATKEFGSQSGPPDNMRDPVDATGW